MQAYVFKRFSTDFYDHVEKCVEIINFVLLSSVFVNDVSYYINERSYFMRSDYRFFM